jgi:hypothetical protein
MKCEMCEMNVQDESEPCREGTTKAGLKENNRIDAPARPPRVIVPVHSLASMVSRLNGVSRPWRLSRDNSSHSGSYLSEPEIVREMQKKKE